ncbi:hypothetical protein AAFF_G00323420 [Aldrovandia affinis]|uniref:SET domain-containing protein n=1 Tax=Aldrovandia affinis TaxID=143900 RepID=A0AAD7W036_9TELE|nr:hypothetical protein AAFF_G00323420 [Aldrovandia affinis]
MSHKFMVVPNTPIPSCAWTSLGRRKKKDHFAGEAGCSSRWLVHLPNLNGCEMWLERPRLSPLQDAKFYITSRTDKPCLEERLVGIKKGRGLFATKLISKGDFVVEYQGELITQQGSEVRADHYKESVVFLFHFKWNGKTCWMQSVRIVIQIVILDPPRPPDACQSKDVPESKRTLSIFRKSIWIVTCLTVRMKMRQHNKVRVFCPTCGKQLTGYGVHKRACLDIDRYYLMMTETLSLFPVVCQEPPEPVDVPTSLWLLSVYGQDIISRMDHIKASNHLHL